MSRLVLVSYLDKPRIKRILTDQHNADESRLIRENPCKSAVDFGVLRAFAAEFAAEHDQFCEC